MLNAISFFTSRTGILLLSLLSLSAVFSWGLVQKLYAARLETQIARSEANYRQRVAEALQQQRDAINQASLAERKRLKELEIKWNRLRTSLKNEKDYSGTAAVSVVHAFNRLSDAPGDRQDVLPAGAGLPVDR